MAAVWTSRGSRPFVMVLTMLATAATSAPLFSADLRPDYRPAAYAITGARIVVDPETTIDAGTVVVRSGLIERVGKADEVAVPYDAETIEGKGLVVYSGFLDLYTTLGQSAGATRSQTGPGRSVPYGDFALPRTPPDNRNGLTPEFEIATALDLPEALAGERRKLGFTGLLAAPGGSIVTGQGALVSLSGLPRREAVVQSPVGLHVSLRAPSEPAPKADDAPAVPRRRGAGPGSVGYPSALMGVIAHLRQAMLDAEHDQELRTFAAQAKGGPALPFDPALRALHAARSGALPVWWEANTRDEILRVLDLAEEFGTKAVIVGGSEAGRVADRLKARDVPVVLRVDFPDEPSVPGEADYRARPPEERPEPLKVLADRAAKWKERVATAKGLAAAGVRFAFSTDGLPKADAFHGQVHKAIAAGLTREAAVAALTRDAALIAGLGDRMGTIAPGKLGHLVVLTAPYGDEAAKVRYILADGLKFSMGDGGRPSRAGEEKKETKADEPKKPEAAQVKPEAPQPKAEATKAEAPQAKANAAQAKAEAPQPKSEAAQAKPESPTPSPPPSAPTPMTRPAQAGAVAPPPRTEEDQPPSTPFVDVATEFEEDRRARIRTGGDVLIRGATILTVSDGTIPGGSILIRGGKIAAVGPGLEAPEGVAVIDATGMVAMPGIIDSHSHMAIQGGVNEMSLSIVPEVRVRDVVNGDDPTIYRALAGGTTSARLLHGSADTIGGQDVVIKLRYGQPGRDLILRDGAQGVKFALGENVTRRVGRFPNTRMGVEATIERAFEEARAYRDEWAAYREAQAGGRAVPPPRRDLRLEALAGVLDGSVKIHCHCYRSDEILMLLRVAERHGVRVQSLQHVLEGYKVAPEIAAHGAGASTFSDWWAYKVEAFDAIPFNSALLTQAGARVSIKSDDEELVRHLYLEAAKMVKYGGVTEAQALEMITLNPARQLGLDHRLGSIEPGKDADIALFNGHPFDGFARCEMSLIDGEVWFQRRDFDGKPRPASPPGDHAAMPLAAAEARARPLEIPEDPKGVYALTGARLHPVSGPAIEAGTLVVSGGKIAAIGGPDTPIPAGAQTVDARGLDVWPGIIDSGTAVGLFEVGSLEETKDYADSAQFQPELRTSVALHPDSELIPVTRANGILTAYVQPSGGTISGQGCVIDLGGWVPSEMVLVDGLALNVTIPRQLPIGPAGRSRSRSGEESEPERQRRERIEAIKEQFRLALAYDRIAAEAKARKAPAPAPDPRMAALAPFAKGEKPVIFRADRRGEILDALKIAGELKLKAIVSGGIDAWKVADSLKAAGVPVLIGGTLQLPTEPSDPYDAPYANPARLHEAGVAFAIRSGGRGPDQATAGRNLPYEAAMAVAYGLPEAEAVKAVTLAPAQILGLADRLGSLEVGKRANLVITAGHLLRPTTVVKALFLGGKPKAPESRHTELYARYQRRLAEVRAGSAPLGIDRAVPATATPAPAGPTAPVAAPAPANGTGAHR